MVVVNQAKSNDKKVVLSTVSHYSSVLIFKKTLDVVETKSGPAQNHFY